MRLENRPRVSRSIVALYGSLTAVVVGIGIFVSFLAYRTGQTVAMAVALPVLSAVAVVLVVVLCSLLRTAYVVSDGRLLIRVSRIVSGPKVVELSKIRSVRRVLIPFGIRLFGASFHGGYYYVPGLGRAFMAITNFSDGVLIETEDGRYIITPSNPDEFIKAVAPST